jgi:hypothetical protein
MNSKNDNHVWENHTIINSKWKEVMLHILAFFGCLATFSLHIPAAIIWFITLGRVNFHRILVNTFFRLNHYLGWDN